MHHSASMSKMLFIVEIKSYLASYHDCFSHLLSIGFNINTNRRRWWAIAVQAGFNSDKQFTVEAHSDALRHII